MAKYKVILRQDATTSEHNSLLWEAGCPLFIEAIQVSRNTESGQAFLQVKVKNITATPIRSFDLGVNVSFEQNREQNVQINMLDADIMPGASKALSPIELTQGDVVGLRYKTLEVKTDDSLWQSQKDPEILPELTSLGLDDALSQERYKLLLEYGAKISHEQRTQNPHMEDKAHIEQNDWWICICGHPNVESDTCAGCNVSKEQIRQTESKEFLERAIEQRKEGERAEAAKRKKAIKVGAVASVAVIAIIAILILIYNFAIVPSQLKSDYEAAIASYDAGDYKKASQQFEALGEYEDSQTRRWQAEFMDSIKPYLNSPKEAYYFPVEDAFKTTLGKEFKFTLNSDGTCTASIPRSNVKYGDWSGNFSDYQGDWSGSWDPDSRQLTLPGFPGGESWTIEGSKKMTGSSKDYLSITSNNSRHSISVY